MKFLTLVCGLCLICWNAYAQSSADLPSTQQLLDESAQLRERRNALEDSYKKDVRQCYQEFDVTDCLTQAREKRIAANAVLRKDELRHSEIQRQVKAQEVRDRLAERNSDANQQQAQDQRAQAQQDSKKRQEENAQKNADHADQGKGRSAYEQKLKEAQEHREALQKRLQDSGKKPAAPLPPPVGVQ